ncbi:hypothetical protein TNCT_266191, partial [Trichonephila clavata]
GSKNRMFLSAESLAWNSGGARAHTWVRHLCRDEVTAPVLQKLRKSHPKRYTMK